MRILTGLLLFSALINLQAWSIGENEKNNLSVSTAVKELKHYLDLCAKDIKIDGKSAVFYIGDTAKAKAAGINTAELAEEEWLIKSDKNNIFITGGGKRGTLYGVFVFIEKYLGVRYFSAYEEYIPAKKELAFKSFNEQGKPFFIMRNVFRDPKFHKDKGRFAAKMRINQDGQTPISAEYGGDYAYGLPAHVHSIERSDGYLPTSKYFKTHPEYYALIDGKRNGSAGRGQICFSNPDLIPIFKSKLREYVKKSEEKARKAGVDMPKIYDISINDNVYFCQCKSCDEAVKKYNRSGVMLRFLNPIAEDLKSYRPDCFVQTLAYFSTIDAPKDTIAADNIIIRFCDTYSNLTEDIKSPVNKSFHDIIINWSKVCKQLVIWDYAITYDESAGMPYTSEFDYDTNFKFYADNNVKGVFMEHENPDNADVYDLKVYLEAKYLENPYLDFKEVYNDFMSKYYGKAAGKIEEYRRRLEKAAVQNKAPMAYFAPDTTGFIYIDLATILDCRRILAEAEEKVKDDPVILHRVRRAGFGADLALGYWLTFSYMIQAKIEGNNIAEIQRLAAEARSRLLDTYNKTIVNLNTKIGSGPLNMLRVITVDNAIKKAKFKAPSILKDKDYVIIEPLAWQRHTGSAAPEEDLNAFYGYVYNIAADSNGNLLKKDIEISYLDEKTDKMTPLTTIKLSDLKNNYQWYKLGDFKFNDEGCICFGKKRFMRLRTDILAKKYCGKEVEIYAEMKFAGPHYKLEGKENAVKLGSIAIVFKPRSLWQKIADLFD